MSAKAQGFIPKTIAHIILIFTLLPIVVVIISAFNASRYFTFPPESLTLEWFGLFIKSKEYQQALRVSVSVATAAVAIALVAGIPAAFAIDRYEFSGKGFLQGVFLSPLMLPSIVWAIALIQYFAYLRVLGSFPALALAHSVIVIPYVIRMVLSSLAFVDKDLESAAQSLGAPPVRSFFEVTMPLIAPGVIVGAVFGFMVSFTDVVVSSFIAGTKYITFPVRVYVELRSEGIDPLAIAVSAVVITLIVILALIGEKTIRWSRFI
jgi:putative spermidine/putrescine transport system permease protein